MSAGREHPKVAAVRAAVRERLAKQEADEASSKDALVQKAASYLETFYQARTPAWLCAARPRDQGIPEVEVEMDDAGASPQRVSTPLWAC